MLGVEFVELHVLSFWVGRAENSKVLEYTERDSAEAGVGMSAAFVQVLELLVWFEVDEEV